MNTVALMQPKIGQFQSWLTARGAEVLMPVPGVELVKFRTPRGHSCITFKKNGIVTFQGEAEDAWKAFCLNLSWRAAPKTKRKGTDHKICAAIRQRDGDLCFFCRQVVSLEDESEEHLISITHGGPDHIANKFLAHKLCNNQVGSLSAIEKIKIHTEAEIERVLTRSKNGRFGT